MYYVVTGAAGFIGANIVRALNDRGVTEVIAVDDLTQGDKFVNLVDCEIADYIDKDEFLDLLSEGRLEESTHVTVVFVTHSIAEAVFLSNRIVVMSPRPGRITEIIENDLPYPRDNTSREDPKFFEKVTQVRELLRDAHEME